MITLTAEININDENPYPFKIGESALGEFSLGETINVKKKIGKESMLSCETQIQSRAYIDKPSFGLVSNSASLSFKDKNGVFLDYCKSGLLGENTFVKFYLDDTISKKSEQIGVYRIRSFDYDNDNFEVLLSLTDGLEKAQEIDVLKFAVTAKPDGEYFGTAETLSHLINTFKEETDIDTNITPNGSIKIRYPYIKSGTLWSQTSKALVAFGAVGYIDKYGQLLANYEIGV